LKEYLSMKYKIIASIVLFKNDIGVLTKTIKSFLNTTLSVKLILVDNSPTDQLRELIPYDSRIEYIFNPSNPGFGASHNIAIKKYLTLSEYYLVLNPDLFFDNGVLENICLYMDDNINIGHLMPKVLYPDGSMQYLCKTNPTVFDLFARRFLPKSLQRIFRKRMERYEYKNRNLDEAIFNVPYLSGCFMFFRSALLEKVGLFDDRIFMYIEDADITRRFLEVSSNIYYPKTHVYHVFEKGSHKNWKLTYYSIHGAFIYFNKWGWKLF